MMVATLALVVVALTTLVRFGWPAVSQEDRQLVLTPARKRKSFPGQQASTSVMVSAFASKGCVRLDSAKKERWRRGDVCSCLARVR